MSVSEQLHSATQQQDVAVMTNLPAGQVTGQSLPSTENRRDRSSALRAVFTRVGATCRKPVDHAIHLRDTTTVVRLSDEASAKLDALISAGLFKTRGETAAFLIEEGIGASAELFRTVTQRLDEIKSLRSELRARSRTLNA